MRPRSGFYRSRDGTERLWLSPADIERMMEDALDRAELSPTEVRPTVDIERFIQSLGVRMDQYADLDSSVLGLTEFHSNQPPRILINRDLTGAIDDDITPPGILGRWRATMAHEASHVVMHRALFEVNQNQWGLFPSESEESSRQLMRCLKKTVLFRGGGTNDWREVQANMGMAALLMPQRLFQKLASTVINRLHLSAVDLSAGSTGTATISAELAKLFSVSKQAAGIRLETLGLVASAKQPWLIHGGFPG
jgi:hypothetical protein